MKYCTHCGAALTADAVIFCPECGKTLKTDTRTGIKQPTKPLQTTISSKKRSPAPSHEKKTTPPKKKKSQKNRIKSTKKDPQASKNKKLPSIKSFLSFPKLFLKKFKSDKNKPLENKQVPDSNPADENYDGYYDNVLPDDNGQTKESLEPEMVKRIILITAGTLLLIIFSIIIMYLL